MKPWQLAWRWAWRDLRGAGAGGMWVALACLMLGTAAMALVGGMRASIQHGIDDQRRTMLGGDIAIEGPDPLPDALRALLSEHGGKLSDSVTMRSMLYAPQTGPERAERMLVEVQGVDPAWPLVGTTTLTPAMSVADCIRQPAAGESGLVADPLVAERLHLTPGAQIRLGGWPLRYRAALTDAPDSSTVSLAPRVIVALPAIQQAGLIKPGMLATWSLRATFPGNDSARQAQVRAIESELTQRFPEAGWHVHDIRDAAATLTRLVNEFGQFLALLGLTALLLGGLGVSAGVASWMGGRRRMTAVLSSLGASSSLIGRVVGLQIGCLCGSGVILGAVTGGILAALLAQLSGAWLPVSPSAAAITAQAALAALTGALTALLFSAPAVLRGLAVSPASLFRDDATARPARPAMIRSLSALTALALLAPILLSAQDRRIAIGFAAAMAVALGLFVLLGHGVRAAARSALHGRRGLTRLVLSLLARRDGPTARLVLGLGMGLTGLATVWLVDGALQNEFAAAMPKTAPSFYFVHIQPDDLPKFDTILKTHAEISDVHELPSMRTRVVSVDGVPAEKVHATSRTQWALKGDHGLTIEPTPAPGTVLAGGQWWKPDYDGDPLLSIDAGLAEGWHVHVGSTLVLNVLGRDITFHIASLRRVQWQSLRMNFAFIASPGMLSHAPHTELATFRTDGVATHDATILADVTDALPGVTGIRVADVLKTLADLVGKLSLALGAMAAVMLASGALVLISALLADRQRRQSESAILRAMGASDRQFRLMWAAEFSILGIISGFGAALCGTTCAALVMREVLYIPMALQPARTALILAGALLLMFGAGLISLRASLRSRPASLLKAR